MPSCFRLFRVPLFPIPRARASSVVVLAAREACPPNIARDVCEKKRREERNPPLASRDVRLSGSIPAYVPLETVETAFRFGMRARRVSCASGIASRSTAK